MKKFFFTLLPALLSVPLSASNGEAHTEKLFNLVNTGDYFHFREEFLADSVNLDPLYRNYFSVWNNSLFNRPEISEAITRQLTDSTAMNCPDSLAEHALMLVFQDKLRLSRFREADSICTHLLFRYGSIMDDDEKKGVREAGDLSALLKDIDPMTVERNGDFSLDYKRDITNLIRIPVQINGHANDYVMDTGANFSAITETQAQEMGLDVRSGNFSITSSSRSSVQARMGVAKEVVIGNAKFRNVVFIVLPDNSLRFAGGLYKINGIIGLPVLAALGELHIFRKKIVFPVAQEEGPGINLGFYGNTSFIDLSFFNDHSPFIFDTGAATSVFGPVALHKFSDALYTTGHGKDKTARIGGAGGVQKVHIIRCKNVAYEGGGKSGTLKMVTVQVDGNTAAFGMFSGIAGEDILMQWNEVVINYRKMFVVFR
ncbi:MAG TPA: retropepsin-like aspartic protease [Bacteroidia bacterium]|nr:retropepsin-like aspartic protease [Bacteroidia bacterium]